MIDPSRQEIKILVPENINRDYSENIAHHDYNHPFFEHFAVKL